MLQGRSQEFYWGFNIGGSILGAADKRVAKGDECGQWECGIFALKWYILVQK